MLDIDGTLCEIVEQADAASIPQRARQSLGALIAARSRGVHVAFVTGRSVTDARRMLGLDGVAIYGNHGMERLSETGVIAGPEGWERAGRELRAARVDLEEIVASIPGTHIEDKEFSLTVHFREMDNAYLPALNERVSIVARRHAVALARGKCVINVLAGDSVTKGDAALEIVNAFGGELASASLLFVGDDVTDEDAFRALAAFPNAITVRVGQPTVATEARFALNDPGEVHLLLDLLAAARR